MKVAVITGGSKGIGYAVAASLLKEGYSVAITSRNIASANEAASKLVAFGDVLAIEADVKNYQSQQDAINLVLEKWGRIDVLIANAGIGSFASIEDLTL
ncbi:MAG: SDR family NAD(P)-dependent oxidoreductase, partial [Pedobacter sp.]